MKICTKCKQNKQLSDFSPDKRHLDGLQSHCKACKRGPVKVWTDNNREYKRSLDREYGSKNSEKIKARSLQWNRDNPESNRSRSAQWKKENPYKVNGQIAKRNYSKIKRTPNWLTEENFAEIDKFYALAHEMSKNIGTKHVVDHIVPLQGKDVSGLHVPWNLRVITNQENCIKGNKFKDSK